MNPSILIVDDDEVVRLVLKAHFTARDIPAHAVADGCEALQALQRGRLQVVVTDLEMPRMGGIELMQTARAQGLILRCVVLTGYATVANLTACLREGAVALVPKPLGDFTALDAAVDDAFAQVRRWTDQMSAIVRLRPDGEDRSTALEPKAPRNG
jgi:CheY-like chemotaxis protein